jgi:hypothetical protein
MWGLNSNQSTIMIRHVFVLTLLMLLPGCGAEPGGASPEAWTLVRSDSNPLITPEMEGAVEEWGYPNINGPSVIRVPDWVEAPLGRYYLYFAHHRGSFIRLAYADDIDGPWTIHRPGVLRLENTPAQDHIASPDVLVDEENRVIRMFYHSVDDTTTWEQTTYLATSPDGLSFDSGARAMGPPYLRAFQMENQWWAIAKVRGGPGGVLLRAESPEGPFVEGPIFLEGMRHGTVLTDGDRVEIVFSRIGDRPERLLRASFDPRAMWEQPFEVEIGELLRPVPDYEGGNLPTSSSRVGEETGPVNALRDPFLFVDQQGRTFLFYSIAGESGIAVARVE